MSGNGTGRYDAIVVGSGAGGLAAALALARAGQRTLVLERHDRAGGWTHSFSLQGYLFSPGVHYIGSLEEGGLLRGIYDGLGVSRNLVFLELNPEGYDHIFVGDFRMDFPKGRERLIERLKERFPKEARGIDAYFAEVRALVEAPGLLGDRRHPLRAAGAAVRALRWLTGTAQDLIDGSVGDPLLRALLAGQSGDHGLPPSRVSAFVHAGIVNHYLEGAWYPRGGAQALPRAFVAALREAGGEIRLGAPVRRILVEGGKVLGVELESGEELRSRVVVSNADPEVTFGSLVGRELLSPRLRGKVERARYSTSCVSLFFATDLDLRERGFDSGNYWFYEHADLEAIYAGGLADAFARGGTPAGQFLTVTTLKDPSKLRSGRHTCESFAFVGYESFAKWARAPFGGRPGDYLALKEELADRMLAGLERRIPGLRSHLLFHSLGTPLSNEHFLSATKGNLYGIEKSPDQVGPFAFHTRTEFEGLFLCGSSTLGHGVAGATLSGIEAAREALGCRSRESLLRSGPGPTFLPSEDYGSWPEEYRSAGEPEPYNPMNSE